MFPAVLGVVTVVFLFMRLIPGDPALFILGDYANEQSLALLRSQLGLDKPLAQQYGIFLLNVAQGDFGESLVTKQSATREILAVFPHSAMLAASGILIATILGIPLGILSAAKQDTNIDYAAMSFALFGISMPTFWIGIMAILLFSHYIPIFPTVGHGDPSNAISYLYHLTLPAATLGLAATAYVARLTRSSVLEVIRQDYIRTARAKGLREREVILKHTLRNALIPVLAMIGLLFGWGLGGTIVLEIVFSRPGVGVALIKAIMARDYAVVQAGVAVLALSFLFINFLVDVLFAIVDPRIRFVA